MSTNNAEGIKFKVMTTGRAEVDNRKPSNLRPLTLPKLYDWIDGQPIDEQLKVELKKSASVYPQQALWSWKKNYTRHLSNIQNALQNTERQQMRPVVELGDEPTTRTYNDSIPENDEFDAGWENPGKN